MIGKNQIQITGTQFSQGLSTSDYLGDGGIGVSSTGLNLITTPGVVRATGASDGGSATLSGNFVASSEDGSSSTNYYRVFVDDAANFYSTDASTITKKKTGSGSFAYSQPTTDMASYGGYVFATSQGDVARVDTSGAWTLIENYWSTTLSGTSLSTGVSHPLLVFEGFLWIGDGNKLHNIDSTGPTANSSVLVLNSSERISTLAIDTNTGLMMVAVQTITTVSGDTFSGRYYIYLYDGYSSKPRRKIPVQGPVQSLTNVGGVIYVGMSNTIGVWTGNGVQFLRRLKNSSFGAANLPTKHRATNAQNQFIVADGGDVLAYGDVLNGKKAWHPLYSSGNVPANPVNFLTVIGSTSNDTNGLTPILAVNFPTLQLRYIKLIDSSVVGTGVFYTNNIYFERPVNIRRIRVFTTGITTTAGIGEVAIIDEKQTTTKPTVSKFVVLAANTPQYVFDFDFNKELTGLQPKITIDTQTFGINRVIIYYDVVQ